MGVLRVAILLIFTGFISGCVSWKTINSISPDLSGYTIMTNEECKEEPGVDGWNPCTLHTAKHSYIYAQMASNAYTDYNNNKLDELKDEPSRPFAYTGAYKLESFDHISKIGYLYEIYKKYEGEEVVEIVISYRGTDGPNWYDWLFGNILTNQRIEAINTFDEVRSRAGNENIPISVVGHSLGGGLAMQVSLCRNVHLNYSFDTSPRFSKRLCGKGNDIYLNENYSIVEYGEINKILRLLGSELTQIYTSLNCISRENPLNQHSMERLASCLSLIASFTSDEAVKSMEMNNIPYDSDGHSFHDFE